MHIDTEKLAREAGLIEPRDVWGDLPADYRVALSTLIARALEEASNCLAQDLAQREVNDVDDMPQQGCVDLIRTLSRQITEDTPHGR